MERAELHQRIAELKAENIPPLTWRDIFTPSEGSDPLSAEEQAALNDYLKVFVAWPTDPQGNTVCIGCRKRVHGGIMGALLGGAPDSTTFNYGIVHGECRCRVCGWPARANHYDIGGTGKDALIQSLTLMLLVHPAELLIEEPVDDEGARQE